MNIKTGTKSITLVTLTAIWSISALNALPGLAVSPILGKMSLLFPDSSQLSIEMLSTLPSLLIIPFILLAGKLTHKANILHILRIGLGIFALSGFLYLLSDKMWQLLIVSILLGIGSGLIVPLSTGLISHFFVGEYRSKQFGLSSAITNLTLVIVTIITGYLAEINWHMPFVVYLLPIISIFLCIPLKIALESNPIITEETQIDIVIKSKKGIDYSRLFPLMIFYGLITFLTMIVVLNIPFVLAYHKYDSSSSGLIISMLFLAIMTPGFFLTPIMRLCGIKTKFICLMLMMIGISIILFTSSIFVIGLGAICVGFGYGVMQPIIYDQTTASAQNSHTTMALAWVMSMNYVAIVLCPIIVDWIQYITHIHTIISPFYLALIGIIGCIAWSYLKRNTPLFKK